MGDAERRAVRARVREEKRQAMFDEMRDISDMDTDEELELQRQIGDLEKKLEDSLRRESRSPGRSLGAAGQSSPRGQCSAVRLDIITQLTTLLAVARGEPAQGRDEEPVERPVGRKSLATSSRSPKFKSPSGPSSYPMDCSPCKTTYAKAFDDYEKAYERPPAPYKPLATTYAWEQPADFDNHRTALRTPDYYGKSLDGIDGKVPRFTGSRELVAPATIGRPHLAPTQVSHGYSQYLNHAGKRIHDFPTTSVANGHKRDQIRATVRFSGKPRESLDAFLTSFVKQARAAMYLDRDCLEVLPTLLDDVAAKWYDEWERVSPFTTFRQLQEGLIDRFGIDTTQTHTLERELYEVRQGDNEAVIAYYGRVTKLTSLLQMNEGEECKVFLRGLNRAITFYMPTHIHATLDSALREAVRTEDRLKGLKIEGLVRPVSATPQVNSISTGEEPAYFKDLAKQVAELTQKLANVEGRRGKNRGNNPYPTNRPPRDITTVQCHNCAQMGHYSSDCSEVKSKCYGCNREGHLTRFCRGNRRTQGQSTNTADIERFCTICNVATHNTDRCRAAKAPQTPPSAPN